jgi:hypothetical protein
MHYPMKKQNKPRPAGEGAPEGQTPKITEFPSVNPDGGRNPWPEITLDLVARTAFDLERFCPKTFKDDAERISHLYWCGSLSVALLGAWAHQLAAARASGEENIVSAIRKVGEEQRMAQESKNVWSGPPVPFHKAAHRMMPKSRKSAAALEAYLEGLLNTLVETLPSETQARYRKLIEEKSLPQDLVEFLVEFYAEFQKFKRSRTARQNALKRRASKLKGDPSQKVQKKLLRSQPRPPAS